MLDATVRRQPYKPEDETDHSLLVFNYVEGAKHHSAVPVRGHQGLETDYLYILRAPDFALEPLDIVIFILRFDWSNLDRHFIFPYENEKREYGTNGNNGRDREIERRRDRETERQMGGEKKRILLRNVGQDGKDAILSHEISSFQGEFCELVNDSSVSPSLRPSISPSLCPSDPLSQGG